MTRLGSPGWRGALAGAVAALPLGAWDGAIALARNPPPPLECLRNLLVACACASLLLPPLGALVHGVGAALSALGRGLRVALGAVVGMTVGALAGFAAFSGAAMQRSPARPWLLAGTGLVASVACAPLARAWPSIRDACLVRPRRVSATLALTALALGYANATVLVRLYPSLHALAALATGALAILSASVWSDALWRARLRVMASAGIVMAAGLVLLARSQRTRGWARRDTAVATYGAALVGRVVPADRTEGRIDDDRVTHGASLDLEGLDILLVTVDALRWDRLGAYGHRGGLTPALDAIAEGGVVIERAYCTTPHTSYSLASLMTGKFFRGVSALAQPSRPHATLAGLLGARGYATAGFYPPAVFSVDGERLGPLRTSAFDFTHKEDSYASASDRARAALAWLARQPPGRPTLAWVHLFEPHESYERHPGARVTGGATVSSRYDAEVAAVDDAIGVLRAGYARLGRRVAIFVTADHGEEFGEHGGRFHGTTLFEEQARVPWLLAVPGLPPRRVEGPASHVDLLPTILAGLGITRPARLRGRDLGPLARGAVWDRVVFASVGSERMAATAAHKLICDVREGSCALFDLRADPWERNDLADARPDLLGALRPRIAGWDASHAVYEREGIADAVQNAEPPSPPAVERAIQGDRSAAVDAARALAGLDARRAIPAVRALAGLGVTDAPVREALAVASERNHRELSLEAGVALARLGDRRGLAACRAGLVSEDGVLRRAAGLGLAALGVADGVPSLAETVLDRTASDQARDEALAALRALSDRRAFDAYAGLLEDPRLAPAAADALGELGDARALPLLESLCDATRYALTRDAALRSLARLGAPSAPRRLRAAILAEPPSIDPLSVLRVLREPFADLTGSLDTVTAAGVEVRASIRLQGPRIRGPAVVLLDLRAEGSCAMRVDSGGPATIVAVGPGTSVARVALAGVRSFVRVSGCAGLRVSAALAVGQRPSARDGR
jgi:arylsulfatase A-like enzyme/HEAT repeat protein